MKEKEIAEIRRRFRADKSNISRVRGCYVNEKKEILSEFDQSLGLMTAEETEEILAILKKTLSGALDRNLLNISFSAEQVLNGEEHRLLSKLRSTALEDADAVKALYEHIIPTIAIDGNFMILLVHDAYDIPSFSKDGEREEESGEMFSYILCSICPVKMTKAVLGYQLHENKFCNLAADWAIAPPELGFLFPAFDDRRANIYNALYYTKDVANNHPDFAETVFHAEVPMPALLQKETFQSVIEDSIGDECSYSVVRAVREELTGILEESKEKKEEDPASVSKETIKSVLESCGIPERRVSAFEEKFEAAFGAEVELRPQNLIDKKPLEVRTPDVFIRVNPEREGLIETRIIDGVKYILIQAGDTIEVDGVNITIS